MLFSVVSLGGMCVFGTLSCWALALRPVSAAWRSAGMLALGSGHLSVRERAEPLDGSVTSTWSQVYFSACTLGGHFTSLSGSRGEVLLCMYSCGADSGRDRLAEALVKRKAVYFKRSVG